MNLDQFAKLKVKHHAYPEYVLYHVLDKEVKKQRELTKELRNKRNEYEIYKKTYDNFVKNNAPRNKFLNFVDVANWNILPMVRKYELLTEIIDIQVKIERFHVDNLQEHVEECGKRGWKIIGNKYFHDFLPTGKDETRTELPQGVE
jgi:hypothetical protein